MLAYYYSVFMHVINELSSEQFQPLLYPSPVFATLFNVLLFTILVLTVLNSLLNSWFWLKLSKQFVDVDWLTDLLPPVALETFRVQQETVSAFEVEC